MLHDLMTERLECLIFFQWYLQVLFTVHFVQSRNVSAVLFSFWVFSDDKTSSAKHAALVAPVSRYFCLVDVIVKDVK